MVFTVLSDSNDVLQRGSSRGTRFEVSFLDLNVADGLQLGSKGQYRYGRRELKTSEGDTDLHQRRNIGGTGGIADCENAGRDERLLQLHDACSLFFSRHGGKRGVVEEPEPEDTETNLGG